MRAWQRNELRPDPKRIGDGWEAVILKHGRS